MEKLSLEEKLRSMTGKEVVLAMIAGLEKEHVKIDMGTFGEVRDGICFGCAATNAICEITGMSYEYILDRTNSPYGQRLQSLRSSFHAVDHFENAVDCLRRGDLTGYNIWVHDFNLYNLSLPKPLKPLPPLNTNDYKNNLGAYKLYAESL